MSIILLIIAIDLLSFFVGIYVGQRYPITTTKEYQRPKPSRDNGKVFDEDTFFVEPKDVVESFNKSSTLDEFINKIK